MPGTKKSVDGADPCEHMHLVRNRPGAPRDVTAADLPTLII